MNDDLELAVKALAAKQADYDTLWRYYDGDQPLTYTASRLREVFQGLDATFAENWCAVVVDSAHERIRLEGLQAPDGTAQQLLEALWSNLELALEADEVHQAALVCGEAFLIAWPDQQTGMAEAYYNDPRLCHVFYEADNPNRKRLAAKWWDDADGHRRVTLYYPDRLEYYRSTNKARDLTADSAKGYRPFPDDQSHVAENPFGLIPVFHFRLSRRRVKGELANVVALQNGINKLLTDMMVSAEFGAFPQRFVISNADVQGKLRNAPNEVWDIPAGDGMGQSTAVGQLPAAQLQNYLHGIDHMAQAVGVISRTPRHYFYRQGGDPSGEALIALEAPLNKKCERHIARFASTWRRVGAFLLLIHDTACTARSQCRTRVAGVELDPKGISPCFARPETVQPRTQAEIRQATVASGVPLTMALRAEGWTDAQIEQMQADRQAEQTAQADLAQAVLDEARRRFDRGQ